MGYLELIVTKYEKSYQPLISNEKDSALHCPPMAKCVLVSCNEEIKCSPGRKTDVMPGCVQSKMMTLAEKRG